MGRASNSGLLPADGDYVPAAEGPARGVRVLAVAAVDASPYDALTGPTLGVRTARPADAGAIAATWQPDLVLLEWELASPSAPQVLQDIRQAHGCPCALVVSIPTGDVITLAAREGFDALLLRPLDPAEIRGLARREQQRTTRSGTWAKAVELPPVVIGSSLPMQETWRRVVQASRTQSPVVVTGETGVGKEVVTRALHLFSPRRGGPFVAVNCAALPESLLESELFGHEKGSFTGAAGQRKGRFEIADGGTLFLDEIGDLPPAVQVKLLRVLQEQVIERVGGSESIRVDVRVVAATHRDLAHEVKQGRFRADLYYRLNVLTIPVPPLRERKEDLIALWNHSIRANAETEHHTPPETSLAVHRRLMRHDWPGNVRELHNAAHHALTVARGAKVMPADLPDYLTQPARAAARFGLSGLTMREIEQAAILETYEALGSIKLAAAMLGVSERKIQYRLKEYREQLPDAEVREVVTPSSARPLRVLLVEDDDELRWELAEHLKSDGHQVIPAADGSAVLVHLGASVFLQGGRDLPDVIITDVRMPGLNGMQILEGVRSRGWAIPVIVISGASDPALRRHATSLGAHSFFDKPLDTAALRQVLQELSQRERWDADEEAALGPRPG